MNYENYVKLSHNFTPKKLHANLLYNSNKNPVSLDFVNYKSNLNVLPKLSDHKINIKLKNYISKDKNSEEEKLCLSNDQYTCTECSNIPLIKNINKSKAIIEIFCNEHGSTKLHIYDYLNKMKQHTYHYYKCDLCLNNLQKDFSDIPFKYCYDCQKNICPNCIILHSKITNNKHINIFNSKEIPVRCETHPTEKYSYYCKYCLRNFCKICVITNPHTHYDEDYCIYKNYLEELPGISEISESFEKLKNENDIYKERLKLIDSLIKFNELLINCCNLYKENYFYLRNIIFVSGTKNNCSNDGINGILHEFQEQVTKLKKNRKFRDEVISKSVNTKKISNSSLKKTNEIKINKEKIIQKLNDKVQKLLDQERSCNIKVNNKTSFSDEIYKEDTNQKELAIKISNLKKNLKPNDNSQKINENIKKKTKNKAKAKVYLKTEENFESKDNDNIINNINISNNNNNIKNQIEIDYDEVAKKSKTIKSKKNNKMIHRSSIVRKIVAKHKRNSVSPEYLSFVKDMPQFKEELSNYDNMCLNAFNASYKTSLQFKEITVDLSGKGIDDEGLILFSEIKFYRLQKLYLWDNVITDLKPLINCKCEYLRVLDLSVNSLRDITILKNLNLLQLRELNFNLNRIKDISVLAEMKCPNLTKLNLANNDIDDIGVLAKVKFYNMENLNLSKNKIKQIDAFEDMNMLQLKELYIDDNIINLDSNKNQIILSHLQFKAKNVKFDIEFDFDYCL